MAGKKRDIDFLRGLLWKTGIMFGFTYFSVAISMQELTVLTPSFLAAGLYLFTELMRFYKIQNKRGKVHTFLI